MFLFSLVWFLLTFWSYPVSCDTSSPDNNTGHSGLSRWFCFTSSHTRDTFSLEPGELELICHPLCREGSQKHTSTIFDVTRWLEGHSVPRLALWCCPLVFTRLIYPQHTHPHFFSVSISACESSLFWQEETKCGSFSLTVPSWSTHYIVMCVSPIFSKGILCISFS